MEVANDRFQDFVQAIQIGSPEQQAGILSYVETVNVPQHLALVAFV